MNLWYNKPIYCCDCEMLNKKTYAYMVGDPHKGEIFEHEWLGSPLGVVYLKFKL
jgi:hypothetical protein